MSISTMRGDGGETSLAGGVRVSKASARVETYGTIDELNSSLGFARSICDDAEIAAFTKGVQQDLFRIGSSLATPHREPEAADPDRSGARRSPDRGGPSDRSDRRHARRLVDPRRAHAPRPPSTWRARSAVAPSARSCGCRKPASPFSRRCWRTSTGCPICSGCSGASSNTTPASAARCAKRPASPATVSHAPGKASTSILLLRVGAVATAACAVLQRRARGRPGAHCLDVAEHHRDAVRARTRRSRRRRLDLLPVSAAGRRRCRRSARFLKPDAELIAGPAARSRRRARGRQRARPAADVAAHPVRDRRSRHAGQRVLVDSPDRERGRRPAIGPTRWSPTSSGASTRSGAPARRAPQPTGALHHRPQPGPLADLVAVGPGSYINELIEIAGGTNVLAIAGQPEYPRISMETVLRLDPDVIVDTVDMGDTEAERRPAAAGQRAAVERLRDADGREDATGSRRHDRRARRARTARRRCGAVGRVACCGRRPAR